MKKIILLILVLAFTSCAKKDVKTDINVDFSQFINGGFPVGATVILYGKSNSGRSFTRILTNTNFSSDIPVDIWDFYIISWSVPNVSNPIDQTPFQGGSTCAVAKNIDLTGAEVTLDLQMNNISCREIDSLYTYGGNNSFAEIDVKILKLKDGNDCTSTDVITIDSEPVGSVNYCEVVDHFARFYVDNSNNGNSLSGRVTSKCLGYQTTNKKINIPKPNVFTNSGFQIYSNGSTAECDGSFADIPFGSLQIKFVGPQNAGGAAAGLYIII